MNMQIQGTMCGFDTINKIASKNKIEVNRTKFNALYGQGIIKNEKVILLKPQTYMNLSGQAVREFRNFYKIDDYKIIIIHDDIDIEEGTIKIRNIGGAGTHNGMKSVVEELGNKKFYRIRIGIGKPENKIDLKDFVLKKIDEEKKEIINDAIIKAAEATEEILTNGIDIAMNKYN